MKKVKKWTELETTDERVERLRNVLLVMALAVVVMAVLGFMLAVIVVQDHDDNEPASPKKVEQTVDPNNEA